MGKHIERIFERMENSPSYYFFIHDEFIRHSRPVSEAGLPYIFDINRYCELEKSSSMAWRLKTRGKLRSRHTYNAIRRAKYLHENIEWK